MAVLLPLFWSLGAIDIEVVVHFPELAELGVAVLLVTENDEVFDDGFKQFYAIEKRVKNNIGVIHGIKRP